MTVKDRVTFIPGGIAVDDRGELMYCNEFDMSKVQRFYEVFNYQPGFVRAWHGHQRETKFIFAAAGAALVAVVEVSDWENPDKDTDIQRFNLSVNQPGVLQIPCGHAHGYKTLLPETRLIIFSTTTLEESLDDDYRFDAHFWDPWEVVER